ncbi:MAG: UDP-3-O-[3-hydroxymyristoyl] N-acetylglucosamine deacetylase [Gemmatimonadetes bacterium]|nr:MAG: UDP-3-O-[3-hydroxymyristoyl] N-acetylglucosamine deacetylase [Gemmatimonadota bacterium]
MPPNGRRSIQKTASVSGTGLHTGAETVATFLPATAGQGIRFRRVDLTGKPEIPARLTEVEALERRTAIGHGDATIHTVEHLLAAVAAHEIDDLIVELSGPEPPILDGSVQPYFDALRQAAPVDVGGQPTMLTVQAPFTVTEGDSSYIVAPAKAFRLTVTIEFPHPLIGRQAGTFEVTADAFARELAPARTFGFTGEVEALRAKGLIKGASASNAIVLDDRGGGLANGGRLRWPDEFVRHKAADIVGDLALTGARIRAHIIATRPSHTGNVALARALERHPIMPGVLIIEAMAQVGGMLLMSHFADQDVTDKVVYFMSLDNVKFRRPVLPGDQIRFELEMIQFRGRTCKMKGVGYVDGQVVAEAEMAAIVTDR